MSNEFSSNRASSIDSRHEDDVDSARWDDDGGHYYAEPDERRLTSRDSEESPTATKDA